LAFLIVIKGSVLFLLDININSIMSYFHYIGFLLFHFCFVSGFTSSRRHISVMPTASRHHAPPTALSAERRISVEYCTGCRWMLRSAWMAQELLTTFEDDLDSVTLIPSRIKPGGVFTVRGNEQVVLWDRKEQGGFPESKELKQKVRDLMAPERNLGHSEGSTSTVTKKEDCVDCPTPPAVQDTYNRIVIPEPHVAITYCTGCRWLLRGAWYAQELLTTFDAELNAVTLIPSRPDDGAQGGTFVS
jgi:selenoprotein W-related protein